MLQFQSSPHVLSDQLSLCRMQGARSGALPQYMSKQKLVLANECVHGTGCSTERGDFARERGPRLLFVWLCSRCVGLSRHNIKRVEMGRLLKAETPSSCVLCTVVPRRVCGVGDAPKPRTAVPHPLLGAAAIRTCRCLRETQAVRYQF
jgi:hypothetical protein